jgi:c-di-GMP-binding flagellar brake protein YcgR
MANSKDPQEIRTGTENRRKYVRVDDLLKVDYRKISEEEHRRYEENQEEIFQRIFGEPFKVPDIEEVDLGLLYRLIYQANLKMDRILAILENRDTDRYESVDTEYVNISGSGMKFTASRGFSTGDILALRIYLPLVSSTWMTVLGKVKSSTELPTKEGYGTAIQFIELSEDDRETIIRHVFKRERELLRVTSDTQEGE